MQIADHRCIDDQVLVSKALSSDSEIRCFQRVEGDVVIVAWLKHDNFRQTDERREVVELTLPCSATTANTYDEAGTLRRREPLTPQPGGTRIRLSLRGGDVSIVEVTNPSPVTRVVTTRAARRPTDFARLAEGRMAALHRAPLPE